MTSRYDYDLFVLGGGSGGVRAVRTAAKLGARVGLAEERHFGGTCVNLGCVPKKLYVYGSHVAKELSDARGYGWSFGDVRFDFATLVERKDAEIARLEGMYRHVLEKAGVDVIRGRGRFVDPHTLEVGERRVTAANVLIATGSWPYRPELPGREVGITSNEVFALRELPKRLAIHGGGYVAVELACIFHALGVETHVIHRGPRLLRTFDADLGEALAGHLRRRGVHLHLEARLVRLEEHGGVVLSHLEDGRVLEGDLFVHATGRRPRVEGIGLEAAGVRLDARGAIAVDAHYRTSTPHVFAVGDVIDRVPLTPVALAEGMAVARTLFGDGPATVDYDLVPTAVFSQPEVAAVGLTEEAARARGHAVRIFRTTFRPLKNALADRDERALMKLVVDADTDRVLGVHVLAPEAGEIVQGFAAALTCGATKAQLDATLAIHPTVAEELVTMREPVG